MLECHLHPPVAGHLADGRVGRHQCPHHRFRRLDDDEQPHRLVDLGHLPRQAGAEVAARPVHDPEQGGDVVRQFGPAPVPGRVGVTEQVFQVDAAAHREHCRQRAGQHRRVRGVLRRVVAGEERPAVEVKPAGAVAAADDADCICGVPQFRPGLRQVFAPPLDVLVRLLRGGRQRARLEPPAPLVRVAVARLLKVRPCLRELAHQFGRQPLGVEQCDRIVTCVVVAADEPRPRRDANPPLLQPGAHPRVVQHVRRRPPVRRARAAPARPAVVGALVRVVQAARPVPEDEHQWCEAVDQPDVTEQPLALGHHLGDAEPEVTVVVAGGRLHPFQCERGVRRGADHPAGGAANFGRQAREQYTGHERHRRERADRRREQRADHRRATAQVEAVPQLAQPQTLLGLLLVVAGGVVVHLFRHPVARFDVDRAKRDEVGVGRPAVVHRHGEEAGGAERLAVRGDLLQVPAERLLAFVEAGDHLERRSRGQLGRVRNAVRQGVERADPQPPLVGAVEQPAAFDGGERFHLAEQVGGGFGQADSTGRLEQGEGALNRCLVSPTRDRGAGSFGGRVVRPSLARRANGGDRRPVQ